ncbi:MAG: hypothetical protein FJ034_02655 [Chloroflexi bacterium]|nr:hypothetical protein [Chloroflexota bacterium]
MLGNVVSFGYQFVMARLLLPAEYAILTALFGYLLLESISTQVIQSAAASLAARYRARGEEDTLHSFTLRWLRRIALLAGPPALLIALASGPLGDLLALPAPTVALLGLTLLTTALLTFTQGLLQGLRTFGWLGAVLLAQAVGRLTIGAALVLAGGGITGAFVGASSAPIIGLAIALFALRPLLGAARAAHREATVGADAKSTQAGRETRFFLLAAVVLLAYAALTNLDAVLARPLLGADAAGAYAGAITLGKVILFAPIAVGFILLERTARAHARGEETERALLIAHGFVLASSGMATLAYLVAPAFFVGIVVGSQYPGAVALAGPYAIAALANAHLSIWIAYFVGRGTMRVGFVLALGVLAEAALLVGTARDAETMVHVVLGVALAMQAAAIATFFLQRRR